MSLNWKEIDRILEELPLEGSHLQKIQQADFASLSLGFYHPGQRFTLAIVLSQGKTRLHLSGKREKKTVALQRFAQLLRSQIGGAKLLSAQQIGQERIVRFLFQKGGKKIILYIRLWGGAGNIIACSEDGEILDAFYRRPGRGEVSGEQFHPDELIKSTKQKHQKQFDVRDYPEDGEPFPFNRFIGETYRQMEIDEQLCQLEKRCRTIAEKRIIHLKASKTELEKQIASAADAKRFKEYGDLLMANLHTLKPGARELVCSNFYRDGEEIRIPLDPKLTGGENGERLYERYKKEERKSEYLLQDLEAARRSIAEYEHFLEHIQESLDSEKLLSLFSDFLAREKESSPKGKETSNQDRPGLSFHSGSFQLIVGRSAKENDILLRKYVKGNDYWLHTRDFPGAYVFIKNIPGKSVPLEVLLDAGNLALFFSQGKSGGKGELYYTQVKYLRRAKHGKTGLVIPTREKNLSVHLEKERTDRLLGREKAR